MAEKIFGHKINASDLLKSNQRGTIDEHDPIYDSESEGGQDDCVFSTYVPPSPPLPEVTQEEFVVKVGGIMKEFFTSLESAEVVSSLKQLGHNECHDLFVAKAVEMSFDHSNAVQQSTAELLTLLVDAHLVSKPQYRWGFEKLVEKFESLQLDVPDVCDRICMFLDCAVLDGIIEGGYMSKLPVQLLMGIKSEGNDEVKDIIASLNELKSKLFVFLVDFFNGASVDETRAFIADQKHPELKHEFVRQLLKQAITDKTDREREMVSRVLSDLYGKGDDGLNMNDIELGFARLVGCTDDLTLDCPHYSEVLAKFIVRGVVDEIVPPSFISTGIRLGLGGESGHKVLMKAEKWAVGKDHMIAARFRKVWTSTDPWRSSAKGFREKVTGVVFEYFHNRDKEGVLTFIRGEGGNECANEEEDKGVSPDELVEVVRKLMYYSMDCKKSERLASIDLIQFLSDKGEVDQDSLTKAFDEAYSHLHDVRRNSPQSRNSRNSLTSLT
eukprot:GHVN01092687.1.p1 GENE.GHVN01092687.1~~GHVN01092687.1.p1  ORF type:complete len:497 (+),score=100.16 GHVN01092687.1:224-1714(+)